MMKSLRFSFVSLSLVLLLNLAMMAGCSSDSGSDDGDGSTVTGTSDGGDDAQSDSTSQEATDQAEGAGNSTDGGEGEQGSDEGTDDSDSGSEAAAIFSGETDGPRLDWTYWRGPFSNGTSSEVGLIDDFDPNGGEGSNVSWKRDDLGGRSTPIVMNGRLYMVVRDKPGTEQEREKVVCLDAATGEDIWENVFNVYLSDVPDTRVGWSSVVGDPETGNLYALGVCGVFQCLDAETGEVKWGLPMHERFGLLSTYGGRTNFPILCDDLVIISSIVIGYAEMAKPAHRFVAFNKTTGDVVWFNGTRPLPYDTTYSGPTVTVLNGQKALVFGSGDGAVWAFQPRTGKPIWQYKFSRRGLNVPPLVVGNTVFTGHSEENISGTAMGAITAINASLDGDVTESGKIWKVEELMVGKAAPLVLGDEVFCFDDRAKLHILDAATGETKYRKKALGTVMRSSPLYADGKIYTVTNNGRWEILKPDPTSDYGVTTVKKGRFPNGEGCDASPIAVNGRIYIHTSGGLYCLEDSAKDKGAYHAPAAPEEATPEAADVATHVQIVPADALSRPGETINYTVRLFNSAGQMIGEADDAEFVVDGNASFGENGALTLSADAAHVVANITATVGDLTGSARVRIVPDLPWSFNFDELSDPPITWVGARYRHVIREVDGSKAMVKITTIPKGTRSRCWFGHSNLSNYTIQADVKGTITNDKMPDIGLIAQGYTLDLQGNGQKLQIRTWGPQLRMAETLDYQWKPDTWYTLKFQASVEDGNAVLRGKIWVKGEAEPDAWTLEAVDDVPVTQGSPGLFGNAKDAELYLDNITVTPNG